MIVFLENKPFTVSFEKQLQKIKIVYVLLKMALPN